MAIELGGGQDCGISRLTRRSLLQGGSAATVSLPLWGETASSRTGGQHGLAGHDAGSFVLWHWPNGNVTRDGLTRDLLAMHRMGIRGAYVHNVAVGIPRGPVDYGSPRWVALLKHALDEALRLRIVLVLHNAAGYSGTGAAWVGPEQAQQQLVWTETRVHGAAAVRLPRPYSKLGWYRDAVVLAYPAAAEEGEVFYDICASVTDNRGVSIDPQVLRGPDPAVRCRITPDGSADASLTIGLTVPFIAQSLTLYRSPEEPRDPFDGPRDYPPRFTLEVSDDGRDYARVCVFDAPALRALESPAVATFPLVKGRFYRLRADGPTWVTGFALHGTARLPDWPVKANAASGTPDGTAWHGGELAGIDPRTVRDVTRYMREDGTLDWPAPPGRWTVLRFGHTATGEHLAAAPDSGRALNIDMFDARMVDRYFAQSLDPLFAKLGDHPGRTLLALQIDSFEAGRQNWTADFPKWFHARCGYALGPWLLAMTGRIVGDANRTERALFDIRSTQSALMIDGYFGRMRENCNRRGLDLIAETYGDGSYDALEAARAVDLAMCEFWARQTYGADTRTQLAVSTEHGRGATLVPAEAFTGEPRTSRYTEYPFALKSQGDRMMTLGITQFVLHSFVHQPHPTAKPGMTMGPFGAHFDRNQTWAGMAHAWTGYLARCQGLLRQGRPVVAVACFKGEDIAGNSPDVRLPPYSIPAGYAADVIDTATLRGLTARASRAVNGANLGYRCIVLPPMPAASLATLRALVTLAKAGVAVVVSTLPRRTIDAAEDREADAAVAELSAELRRLGAATLDEAFQKSGIAPDFEVVASRPDAAIHWARRDLSAGPIWFVSNERRRAESITVRLPAQGAASLWWPDRNETSPAVLRPGPGGTSDVTLVLPPAGAVFVRFDRPHPTLEAIRHDGRPFASFATVEEPVETGGDFTVMLWAKPETFMLPGRGFLFYPDDGSQRGPGHVSVGLAAGNNGITVFERGAAGPVPVLDVKEAFAGWTHVTLVYRSGIPSVFVDGKLCGQGTRRATHCRPGLWTKDTYEQIRTRFEGEQTPAQLSWKALGPSQIEAAVGAGVPPPPMREALTISIDESGLRRALAREDGMHEIVRTGAAPVEWDVRGTHKEVLEGPWELALERDGLSPLSAKLDTLRSLSKHTDPDIAHFAGTARYRITFNCRSMPADYRLLLDLGRVECIARVTLNGKAVGTCWAPPHELDVTAWVRAGLNDLEISVACLWPNRLIAEARRSFDRAYASSGAIKDLPLWYQNSDPPPRLGKTFTTWRHYTGVEPLLDSGLLGPVRLIRAKTRSLC